MQGTTRPEFRPLTPDELAQTVAMARAGQARALGVLLRRLARRLRAILTRCGMAASRAWQAFQEWRRVRRASAQLGSLNDVMLKDMGVCRSEIPWLAEHGRADRGPAAGLTLLRRLPALRSTAAEQSAPDKDAA